ncbi:uncharacterized protein Dwil_GK14233 [Drosophila willistoni]|uniref:Uncharacterized protein n=2 Tax=Drosophila willistoni TaxID=7260 RepID=B4NHP9_DROWI|nr:uncharacterized protein Dwil_GK14233 [Drosophila willistoni]
MTRSESKVDVQRLYDAYRQRFRKESDDPEEDDIGGDLKEVLTNEKVEDINDKADIKSNKKETQLHLKSPTTIKTDELSKKEEDSNNNVEIETDPKSIKKKTPLNRPPGNKADMKNNLKPIKKENQIPLARTSTESKVTNERPKAMEVRKKPEVKSPAVSGMVTMKLDGPPLMGITSSKVLPPHAGFKQQLDDSDRQILELNRIYHEMMSAFQKTLSISAGKSSMTKPVHLSPITQLVNIFKRLSHTDLVGEIAKKINDEMELEINQPILENTQDVSLVAADNSLMSQCEIKDTDDINELFDRMDPRRASSVFKRVANEMKAVRPLIKSGGLYDEYKKRLFKILKEQKYPRRSITSDPIESESSQKLIKKTTETRLREGAEMPTKSSVKNNNYLKALETYIKTNKESQLNGGIKPYYLPNSKNRQLVWNEVPLLKPKEGESPKKSDQKSAGLKEDHKKPITNNIYSGIEPQQIESGIKALKHSSLFSLLDEYEKQINDINQALQAKQRWWKEALPKDNPNSGNAQGFVPSKDDQLTSCLQESPERAFVSSNTFPGVLLDLPAGMNSQQPIGGNVIDNLASQMKLSPLELAQRIATAASSATGQSMQGIGMVMPSTPPPPQAATVASQINVNQMANATKATTENQGQTPNLAPILDKILQRLETMKDMKLNQAEESNANPLPCCFAEPSDGTPCDLNGSWESLLLGIRINIRGTTKGSGSGSEDEVTKPTCAQPKRKSSASLSSLHRQWRQCVKINSTQIKALTPGLAPTFQWLNITIQETTPPKQHELIDNITEWTFSGYTLNILGGPISLSCRRTDSNLIGTFVGYCRTCGCVDTVFGSWTFCQPSRDCQDITTSIFDRRDMLRRYSMEDKRTSRFKEQLYLRSKFAQMEKNRQQAKQIAFDKVQAFPPPQNENIHSQPGPVQDPHQTRPIFQSLY